MLAFKVKGDEAAILAPARGRIVDGWRAPGDGMTLAPGTRRPCELPDPVGTAALTCLSRACPVSFEETPATAWRRRCEAKMRVLKAFGERIATREPDRQTAEIQIRVARVNRFNGIGTAEVVRVA